MIKLISVLILAAGSVSAGNFEPIKTLQVTYGVYSTCFSPDGKYFVSAGDSFKSSHDVITLWSMPEGILLRTIDANTDEVRSVAISPDSKYLAAGARNGALALWTIPDGKFVKTLEGSGVVKWGG